MIVKRCLLLGDDRVLHALAQTEFERGLGWNLDRLARLRVAAFARLSLRENHFAEAGEDELAVALDFACREAGQLLEEFFNLCALQIELLGEVVDL